MYNASYSKLSCPFCHVTEALGSDKLTADDEILVRRHLALDHGWICEEEFKSWR